MSNPFHSAARQLEKAGARATGHRIRAEGRIVETLVAASLALGYSVSVNDGEETVLRRSTDAKAIIAAMFSTDEDRLYVHGSDGVLQAQFYLVYGNDGYDAISDYSANPIAEHIMAAVQPIIDKEESRPAFA